jgi:hypothetical protein
MKVMEKVDWKNVKFEKVDYHEIELLRAVFEDPNENTTRRSISKEYYKWKFDDNPAGKGILHVAKIEDRIVGMVSITPKIFLFRGNIIKSGELGDCFINPRYNRRGMFNSLLTSTANEALSQGYEFIYGTPNPIALPGERKAGYEIIPSLEIQNMVLPLYPETLLPHIKKLKQYRKFLKIPFTFVGYFIRLFSRISSLLNVVRYRRLNINFEDLTEFPDELIKQVRYEANEIDGVSFKDTNYFRWRYFRNVDDYAIYGIKSESSYVGYIVLKEGVWQGLKLGYIADYHLAKNHVNLISPMLDYTLGYFRKRGMRMISIWCSPNNYTHKILKRKLYIKHNDIPVICFKNKFGSELIESELDWHFMLSDTDNI